ncbi:MAG: delta-60 repeat domain-containing protein [Flavobacteriales bacterium]
MTHARSLSLLFFVPILSSLGLGSRAQSPTVDPDFDTGVGANAIISTTLVQPDGKVILAGQFTSFNGSPAGRIVRVDASGVIDPTFDVGAGFNDQVTGAHLYADGSILVIGSFSMYDTNSPAPRIIKLLSNGSIDPSFTPPVLNATLLVQLAVRSDGRILVSGSFFTPQFNRLARLLPNGDPDPDFDTYDRFNSSVNNFDQLSDGRIVVVGAFTSVNGIPRNSVAVLHANGQFDPSFDPGVGPTGLVTNVAVDPLDRILLFGSMSAWNGQPARLIRLLTTGVVDPSFSLPTFNSNVLRCVIEPDGSILAGGLFFSVNGLTIRGLCKLDPNGILVPDFDPSSPSVGVQVYRIERASNGNLMIAGSFSQFGGLTRKNVVRLSSCVQETWYADTDGDGAGDPNSSVVSCTMPPGHVANNTDCDDSDPDITGPTTWYIDGDGDGYGNIFAPTQLACSAPVGHVDNADDCNDSDPTTHAVRNWFADTDEDGYGDPTVIISACNQPAGHVSDPTDCDDNDPLVFVGAACDDGHPLTLNDSIGEDCICRGSGLQVEVHAWLEGAYTPGDLMSAGLFENGLIPITEPYTAHGYVHVGGGGGETTTLQMLDPFPGMDEHTAVDWVVLELRDGSQAGVIISTRSCILRRNGLITRPDGLELPVFDEAPGSYHIAVRHRNHLGFVTLIPVDLDQPLPPVVDFASGQTATAGTNALKTMGQRLVMWSGDAGSDGNLKYTGQFNDRDLILSRIGGSIPTNTVSGYFREDLNLDGIVRYAGANNDRDLILQNIGGVVPTNVRYDQLPN